MQHVSVTTTAPDAQTPSQAELEGILPQSLASVRDSILALIPPKSTDLAQAASYALSGGGKLVRPSMGLLIGAMLGRSSDARVIEAAAVAEIIHVATLLHDDVIDEAATRRGRPALRIVRDNRSAILTGDYLLAQASLKLAKIGVVPVIAIFSQVLADLCDGEMLQDALQYDLKATTWAAYTQKTYGKTASLFGAVCESVAILCEVPAAACQSLRRFGEQIGLAFQVIDDWLDVTQDAQTLGKPAQDDLRHGLVTAPVILALEGLLTSDAANVLQQKIEAVFKTSGRLGPDAVTAEQLLEIQTLLEACGAIEATQVKAKAQIAIAKESLASLPAGLIQSQAAFNQLLALADSVVARKA
ncbi:MAG: polyprenyl synthetase family protein [Vampirovibrionales bacterium]|nr:polyprenyl synthetase family protein [Vampirovibrionales bacterium]